MTSSILRTSLFTLVAFAGSLHAQPQLPATVDLAVVISVMKDQAATPTQKQALIGKVYSGVVSVAAVRLSPTDPTVVTVDAEPDSQGDDSAPTSIRMRFTGAADDEKLMQLSKGQRVRVRGRLKDFSTLRSTNWANFTDLVIEGPPGHP